MLQPPLKQLYVRPYVRSKDGVSLLCKYTHARMNVEQTICGSHFKPWQWAKPFTNYFVNTIVQNCLARIVWTVKGKRAKGWSISSGDTSLRTTYVHRSNRFELVLMLATCSVTLAGACPSPRLVTPSSEVKFVLYNQGGLLRAATEAGTACVYIPRVLQQHNGVSEWTCMQMSLRMCVCAVLRQGSCRMQSTMHEPVNSNNMVHAYCTYCTYVCRK